MNKGSNNYPSTRNADSSQLYEILEARPGMRNALRICSVPLRLSSPLVSELLRRFAPNADVTEFWQRLKEFGLVTERDENEWRLDLKTRQYFLDKLEQADTKLAKKIHAAVLDYLEKTAQPILDKDQDRLQQAYHTAPLDQDKAVALYWSAYCQARTSNRFAMLPALAHLAESQTNWLTHHTKSIKLFRAAALYYGGTLEDRPRAAELLESILEQGAPVPVTIDASFLLGTFEEQVNRDQAARLYEQIIKLKDDLDLKKEDPDVQRHLRLTLAKSFFNLASILQIEGHPQALEKAESYYRHGIQIVSSGLDPGYEAAQRRHLVEVQQRLGEEQDKVRDSIQRISQIEDPFRQDFLRDALARADDIGYLYYAISALNHGWGYDRQQIQIEVAQDGATRLEGAHTLRATSALFRTDFYLETVPESQVGVHFESLESLTPGFTVQPRPLNAESRAMEKLEMVIDPPMQPGDQLTYRWTARSSPGTVATTPQQLEEAGLTFEYAFWDITVPIQQLELQVTIPWEQMQLKPTAWFEVWTVGRWQAHRQAQTAYRAFSPEDSPGRVRLNVETISPDQSRLSLTINYPYLAMRYVLAWKVGE